MPGVITLVVDGALGGQDLEGGQPHSFQSVHRPAVPPVGGGERLGVGGAGGGPGGERPRVHAPRGRPGEQARGLGQGGPRRGPDRGVLVPQQIPGLDRPGHQLTVEQYPPAIQFLPEPGRADRGAHHVQQLPREPRAALFPGRPAGRAEERPPGAGVHRPGQAVRRAEPGPGRLLVAAGQQHGPGAHVLFLAEHVGDAVGPVGRERFGRMLQHIRPGGRGGGRHRGREVEHPPRVGREPAHDLQGARRVLLADRDPAVVRGLDHPLAQDVGDVQDPGVAAGRVSSGPRDPGQVSVVRGEGGVREKQGPRGFVPDPLGGH